jgi:hypothetical protein
VRLGDIYTKHAVRRLSIEFVVLLIALAGQSLGQSLPALPKPDKDPFVGTWKANADKSRPKSDKDAWYVKTISRDGDDRVISSRSKKPGPAPLIKGKSYSEILEKDYRIRCDGLPHTAPCGVFSCTTSCIYKTANSVQGETHFECPQVERCVTQYWTEEVSADGQEMIISAYRDETRTKRKSVEVLDRVK